MKKLLLAFIVLVLVLSCGTGNKENKDSNENLTVILGKIENARDMVVSIMHNSQTDTIRLDEQGKFTYELLLSSPTNIVLINGVNQTNIYALPKTKINFTANYADFSASIKYTGDKAEVNNYLAKQSHSTLNSGIKTEKFLFAPDYQTFAISLNKFNKIFNQNLDDFASKHDNYVAFVALEKEKLKIIEASLMISFYTPLINVNQKRIDIENDIDQIIASTDLNNPEIIHLFEFRQFAQNLIAYKLNQKLRNANIKVNSAKEYAAEYFMVLEEIFIEKIVLEELYYQLIKEFMAAYGAETVIEQYTNYKDITSNKKRLSELEKIFTEYDKLSSGNPSVEWSFPDVNEKIYSLSNFRGKYVYIDVWAAWCGPCKQEIPYFKKLKEKFNGKNIEFIGISVDESRNDWVTAINSNSLTGVQLWAAGWKNPLCEYFKITGIPRFILIDKNGNILNANADRPSGDIETVLNNLEGI